MLRDEFLLMQRQDLVTLNNPDLDVLSDVFEEVLKKLPKNTEIDSSKSVEKCFSQMREYARKNARNGFFAFSPMSTFDFVSKYLEVDTTSVNVSFENELVDLRDFL